MNRLFRSNAEGALFRWHSPTIHRTRKEHHTHCEPKSGYAWFKRSSRLSRSKCLKNRAERLNGAQRLNILNGLTSSTVSCPLPATGAAWSSVTAVMNHPLQGYSHHAAQRSDFAIRVAS